MRKFRVTALHPIRYAFWPAMAQRHVGRMLESGESLVMTPREYRDFRPVAPVDYPEVPFRVEEIEG